MVLSTSILLAKTVVRPSGRKVRVKTNFLDRVRLSVRAGNGGSGQPKINGIGGDGGDVYVVADKSTTLAQLLVEYPERRMKASSGAISSKQALLGLKGPDSLIKVPLGVTVSEDGKQLGDLVKHEDQLLVAKGGMGGSPSTNFIGTRGQQKVLTLILKLIADVGFVGFPNAGKSTLLRALSRAKPQVADYPFTTLSPNIGIIQYPDLRTISCADLPGLIEGAHKNVGLGHQFLRHVERTKLLLYIVDVNGFQLNPTSPRRDAFETVMTLNKELELYRKDLLEKPSILVVNKLDSPEGPEKFEELKRKMRDDEIFEQLPETIKPETRILFRETIGIVARDMENCQTLKEELRAELDELYEEELEAGFKDRQPITPTILKNQLG